MTKESHIQSTLNLNFKAVEKLVLDLLKKQNFDFKGQEIKVEAVKIKGAGEKLNIEALLSGAFDGTMNLVGKPVFESEQQVIQFEGVDIDLEGSNFLSKTIVLFLGNYIEDKIAPYLKFSLKKQTEPLNQIIKYIPIKYGLFANAKINNFDIPQIDISNDSMILHLSIKGNLDLGMESDLV